MGPAGVEPAAAAYKAAALPLSYEPVRTAGVDPAASRMSTGRSAGELRARVAVDRRGIEPRSRQCHCRVFPLDDQPAMVPRSGIDPDSPAFQTGAFT